MMITTIVRTNETKNAKNIFLFIYQNCKLDDEYYKVDGTTYAL